MTSLGYAKAVRYLSRFPRLMAQDDDMGLPASVIALRPGTSSPDDSELVARAAEDATWAKSELFKRHAPWVTAMLTRLLASSADAEDAAQDSFVIAFRDLGQLRERGAFGGWLRQIAVHQAHRKFRRRKLLSTFGLSGRDDDASLAQLADLGASPETLTELAKLDQVLRKLPAAERMAWMLRHVEGYELVEVAEACGCSLATVKRRITAAHERVTAHVTIEEVADE
jgi:RNA polymerase sigma-70 factor, ECF subfamily